ncbi:hypothetical protein [Treponema sp. R6D11]
MNKEQEKNKKKTILLMVLVIIILSLFAFFSFARYFRWGAGSGEIEVAKPVFSITPAINNTVIISDSEVEINFSIANFNELQEKSDVSFNYTVEFGLVNNSFSLNDFSKFELKKNGVVIPLSNFKTGVQTIEQNQKKNDFYTLTIAANDYELQNIADRLKIEFKGEQKLDF